MVPEVVRLVSPSTGEMLSISEQTSRRQADVRVDGLYPFVGPLDEELGVEKSLDTEDHTVRATETDCDSANQHYIQKGEGYVWKDGLGAGCGEGKG